MASTVAVLSDIHGVLPALEHVLAEPAVADAELIVVTGDHTWGPQPTEVLDRLTALGDRAVLVRGNADRELLQMSRGIDVGLADDPLSVWGAAQLVPEHQQLLDAMPKQVTIEIAGFGPVRFCHATPRPQVAQWVEENLRYPASDIEAVEAFGPETDAERFSSTLIHGKTG